MPSPETCVRRPAVASSALVLTWSAGFVGAALAAPYAPAVTTLSWRMLATGALLLTVMAVRRRPVPRRAVAQHVVLGLLMQCGYLGGVFGAASAGVPAGTIALIAATQPLAVLGLSRLLLGARTRFVQMAALAVGVLGVGAVVAGDVAEGTAPWWALALPLLATAAMSTGTVLQERWQPGCSLLDALTVQACTAAVVFCGMAVVTGTLRPPVTLGFAGAVGWTVVFAGLGGYGSYLLCLRLMGATAVSTVLLLTPPTTVVWAWAMLGQAPSPLLLPGAVLCAAAVVVALRTGRVAATAPTGGGSAGVQRPGAVWSGPEPPGPVPPCPAPARRQLAGGAR